MQKKLKRFVRVHDIHGNEVELPYPAECGNRVKCNMSILETTRTQLNSLKDTYGLTLGEVIDWAVCNLYYTMTVLDREDDSDGKEEGDNGAGE